MTFVSFLDIYLKTLSNLGYFGLMLIMAVEGTFFPVLIPMEAVVIPMGYLAYTGEKSMSLLIFFATTGTVLGCVVNYYLSLLLGRPFIYKYAKFIMLNTKKLEKLENSFLRNSKLIMFFGRCAPLPGIKHIVTIPAGISKMNMRDFLLYNTLGAIFYLTIIFHIGFFSAGNKNIMHYVQNIAILILILSICIYGLLKFGVRYRKRRKK